jgi:hypothetical protein
MDVQPRCLQDSECELWRLLSDRGPLSMIRYLILFLLIACTVSPALAQSIGSQPDAKSAPQGAPQQTVIGDYLSLGIDGRRGHEFLFGYLECPYMHTRGTRVRSRPAMTNAQFAGRRTSLEQKMISARKQVLREK